MQLRISRNFSETDLLHNVTFGNFARGWILYFDRSIVDIIQINVWLPTDAREDTERCIVITGKIMASREINEVSERTRFPPEDQTTKSQKVTALQLVPH
jgi:hypothetical protein